MGQRSIFVSLIVFQIFCLPLFTTICAQSVRVAPIRYEHSRAFASASSSSSSSFSSDNLTPTISARKGRQVHLDCNGQNLDSLTAIACATPEVCQEKEICLSNNKREGCSLESGKEIFYGGPCYHDEGHGNCFSIDIEPLITAGMVECQTRQGHRAVDHFYYGVDGGFHLASKPPKSSLIALQLSSPHSDARGTGERGDLLELYKFEEVSGKCIVPQFTSVGAPNIEFRGIKKDGLKYRIDDCNCITENRVGGLRTVSIHRYSVPDDVIGFYCAVANSNRAAKSVNGGLEEDVTSTVVNVTVWNK